MRDGEHRFALVDADQVRSRMLVRDAPQRLPGSRSQVEDRVRHDFARGFGDEPDPEAPASHVRPEDGSLFVFLDEAAASAL